MKLGWKKTFLIGMGFLGISLVWQIYDSFVPIFLQGGNAEYDRQAGAVMHEVLPGETLTDIAAQYTDVTVDDLKALNVLDDDIDLAERTGEGITVQPYTGFGLSVSLSGLVMTLDNVAALFILPLIGIWSDHTRSRIGRRYPYIVTAAPVAALAFVGVPLAVKMIDTTKNGSIDSNTGAFALFLAALGLTLTAMAVLRTPVVALMPDLVPSMLRSKANGIINLMGGVGGIIGALGLARLFDAEPLLPFLVSSTVLAVTIALLFLTVREPDAAQLADIHAHSDESNVKALPGLKDVKLIPQDHRRSLTFLLLAIFSWFVGYNAISTFFSSYAVTTLNVSAGAAPSLFSAALAAFIIFAVPSGYIGTRYGRRRTINAGLAIFAVLLVVAFFVRSMPLLLVILALGGGAWALVNINSLPMVVDITDDPRLLGTYTGLYYLAAQAAAIVGPVLNSLIIEHLANYNYSIIFLVAPTFFILAIVCMYNVTRGEAHA